MEKSLYTAEEIAFVLRRVEEELREVAGRGAAPDGEVCGGLNCSSSYIICARFSSLHTSLERGQGSR